MSLFDDQLADFRELPPPFNGRNSPTDQKKKETSDVPLGLHTVLQKTQKMFLEKSLMITNTSQDQLKPFTALNSAMIVQNLLNGEHMLTFLDFREYFSSWNSSARICIFQQEKSLKTMFLHCITSVSLGKF